MARTRQADPLVLYSTITTMAYNLGEKFYGGVHYVWCAPAPRTDPHAIGNPPSSEPLAIYRRYQRDVVEDDGHSGSIAQNRVGLLNGANIKHRAKVIDDAERTSIEEMVNAARFRYFEPLLLVIPYSSRVKRLVTPAPVGMRASAMSEEYTIEELPRACFDVLKLDR